ncbi:hypothetical protein DPMN_119972, partial [Dreissena polymorpha]
MSEEYEYDSDGTVGRDAVIEIGTKLFCHLTKKHSHLWRNVVRKLNGPSHIRIF